MIKEITELLHENEIAKIIAGYDNYYATNYGRVLSYRRGKVTELRFGRSASGHLHVNLCKNGKCSSRKVHQLVIETFVGPRPYKYDVRHLNGIPTDNRLDNLAYGTRKENGQDNILHGVSPRGQRNGMSKLNDIDVIEIREKYASGKYRHQDLADEYGVGRRHIGDIVNRVNWEWLDRSQVQSFDVDGIPVIAVITPENYSVNIYA